MGSLQCSPYPLAGLKGPTSKGRGKRAGEGDGIGGKEGGRERARGRREQEGTEFGPSQSWKQIDATGCNWVSRSTCGQCVMWNQCC